ncbi:MAG: RlpA-like protein precursor [Alphaproteobacteria bacterium]|nr:RlpA-like protein precursor [Alphaproteobacteria bacterium]
MFRFSLLLFTLAFLVTGCADKRPQAEWWHPAPPQATPRSQGSFKVGKPYSQSGKNYVPTESYSYDETGIASWYGDEFHGKRTANGEVFSKNSLSAAHPTLQLPALIRVTNLGNGRSAVLRVNDRGPFSKSRLIDVSHKSATVLGFDGAGTARVRVQVLDKESRVLADAARKGFPPDVQMAMAFRIAPIPETVVKDVKVVEEVDKTIEVATEDKAIVKVENTKVATTELSPVPPVTKTEVEELNKELFRKYPVSPTNIFIQVGSFASLANANALKPRLAPLGNVTVSPTQVNGAPFNRVRIGPIATVAQADILLKKTIATGFPAARIIVD